MVLRQKLGGLGKNERGFTLLEVMITIVLIGIVMAIASSTWFGVVESRRVDSAADEVAGALRLAHASATNRLGTARVEFRSNGTGVPAANCGGTPADYCLVRPTAGGGPEFLRRYLPDGVTLTSPNLLAVVAGSTSAVQFNPDGSASALGTIGSVSGVTDNCPASTPTGVPRLQVTVDGNPTRCITFNAATSRIRVD